MAGYGVAFAIASLSCTIGPFLAATGIALRGGDIGTGLATFVTYALGMGLVVAVLPYVPRIGGALLLITGAYVGYYGYYELQLFHGDGDPLDPIVDAAGEIQSTLVGWLDTIGPVPLLITLTVLVGGGIVLTRRTRAK